MIKVQVPVVIVGKQVCHGMLDWLIGPRYYVTIRPLDILEPMTVEYRVNSHVYHDLEVGEEILLSFVKTPHNTYQLYRPW